MDANIGQSVEKDLTLPVGWKRRETGRFVRENIQQLVEKNPFQLVCSKCVSRLKYTCLFVGVPVRPLQVPDKSTKRCCFAIVLCERRIIR